MGERLSRIAQFGMLLLLGCASGTSSLVSAAPQAAVIEQTIRRPNSAASSTPPQATAAARAADLLGIFPAGACGFSPYLNGPCSPFGQPSFAVILAESAVPLALPARDKSTRAFFGDLPVTPERELRRLEALLASAKELDLPPGYPFVSSYDDIPDQTFERRGLAIVAGLFGSKKAAISYVEQRAISTRFARVEIVALSPSARVCDGDHEQCEKTTFSAVEVAIPARAFAGSDLERVERIIDRHFESELAKAKARDLELAKLSVRCVVPAGRVFLTNHEQMYQQFRQYAPVTCSDGRTAWIPWRATRLESVVTTSPEGTRIHQVVDVACDSPRIESRSFLSELPVTEFASAPCGG